jgi:hypothetical protein
MHTWDLQHRRTVSIIFDTKTNIHYILPVMADDRAPMSFREKSAWIALAAFAGIFALYCWNVVAIVAGRGHGVGEPTALVLVLLAALVIAEGMLHWIVARRSPIEARTPRDEREWLIELKAARIAFFVLLATTFSSNGMLHLRGIGRWEMAQAVMAAIALAEVVNFASRIVLYRRDA